MKLAHWPDSFEGRAILAVVGMSLTVWLAWSAFALWDAGREQSTLFDEELKDTAEVIVAAFPKVVFDQGLSMNFKLPSGGSTLEFNFQVWTRERRLVSRTETTPTEPLNPSFEPGFHSQRVGGQVWRSYSLNDESGAIQVQMGEHVAQRRGFARLDAIKGLGGLTFLLVAVAAALIGAMLWTARPLQRLRRQVETRAPTDTTALPLDGLPAEVRPLVQAFNHLLQRAEAARESQLRFVADAAHELRTPLAALKLQAQVAQRARSPEDVQAALGRLQSGIDRSTRVTEQLLELARMDGQSSVEPVALLDATQLLNCAAETCWPLAARRGMRLRFAAEVPELLAPPGLVEVALRNLLDNSLRYGPEGGCVTLGTMRRAGRDCVYVSDQGPGLDAAQREQALRPFVRLHDGAETGSGLGLSIVQRVARLMGAELRLEDAEPGPGLRALLLLN
jgi:signal transduction histidine kinase